jgi:hypothetical protein
VNSVRSEIAVEIFFVPISTGKWHNQIKLGGTSFYEADRFWIIDPCRHVFDRRLHCVVLRFSIHAVDGCQSLPRECAGRGKQDLRLEDHDGDRENARAVAAGEDQIEEKPASGLFLRPSAEPLEIFFASI